MPTPKQSNKEAKSPVVKRDPEYFRVASKHQIREKNLDKTLADSFPTSDPPSTIPDPSAADSDTGPVADDRD
jgi:hypothetical protein